VLRLVSDAHVIGSGSTPGELNALSILSHGAPPGTLVLRRPDRSPFLQLQIDLQYSVIFALDATSRSLYRVVIARYIYTVLDVGDRELFGYHLHPFGLSPIETPHLHFRGASPIALPPKAANAVPFELDLSHAHFPTHRIELADLIRFLIRDLGVAPRRSDWERVLDHY
jgi:hypothetical protein